MRAPCVAIALKHGNCCGAAYDPSIIQTIRWMLEGDLIAVFGGVIMTTFAITEQVAYELLHYKSPSRRFLTAVVAPGFTLEAITLLRGKHDSCALVMNPVLEHLTIEHLDNSDMIRPVRGGFLRQKNYTYVPDLSAPETHWYAVDLSIGDPESMLLAWAIAATSNSNTITLVHHHKLIANAVGQQDRVGAAKLAIERAIRSHQECQSLTERIAGSVACSDSFFPFPDAPELLIAADIKAILATSGSKNDQATIELCERRGVSLCLIPDKIGRGFFRH